VRDGFAMRRTLSGALPCLLPVWQGLLIEARFGVVMCQHLGLRLYQVGKLARQHLGNLPMILLPRVA
jgi:hypothetical protein